ncbi:MAG: hypothetical protein EOP86_02250 [Verrucomicrobiaceae bacterium]|nr:MAG: hypothetical protein EOP86_02250 [Verrucomicrobiaceae bacterium]
MVTPKYEREPGNAPGSFYVVKDQCFLCGLPSATAPRNITFREGGCGCGGLTNHCRVEHQPGTWEETVSVMEAARTSCIAAIRYRGTDPRILEWFRTNGCAFLCDAPGA